MTAIRSKMSIRRRNANSNFPAGPDEGGWEGTGTVVLETEMVGNCTDEVDREDGTVVLVVVVTVELVWPSYELQRFRLAESGSAILVRVAW